MCDYERKEMGFLKENYGITHVFIDGDRNVMFANAITIFIGIKKKHVFSIFIVAVNKLLHGCLTYQGLVEKNHVFRRKEFV